MANERKAQLLFKELLAGLSDDIRKVYEKQTDVSKDISLSIDDNLYKNVCILSTVIINDMLSKGADIEKYMHEIEAELKGNKILIADDIDTLSPGLLELIKDKNNIISRYLEVHNVELRLNNDFIDSAIELYAIYFKIDIDLRDNDDDNEKLLRECLSNTFSIDGNINNVMKRYEMLFMSGYDLSRPHGLLSNNCIIYTSNGGLMSRKGKGAIKIKPIHDISTYFTNLLGYTICEDRYYADMAKTLQESFINNVKLLYFPNKLVEYAYGMKPLSDKNSNSYVRLSSSSDWGKCSKIIRKDIYLTVVDALVLYCKNILKVDLQNEEDIETKIIANMTTLDKYINFICNSLSTCVIFNEYKSSNDNDVPVAFRIRVSDVLGSINKDLNKDIIGLFGIGDGGRDGQTLSSSIDEVNSKTYGVYEYVHEFNHTLSNAMPLFAYKALMKLKEKGEQLSYRNLILGQNQDGTILRNGSENVNLNNKLFHYINAGSRSGKGVMTLNFLVAALMSNKALIYLDNKPDMASLLSYMAGGSTEKGPKGFFLNGANFKDDTYNQYKPFVNNWINNDNIPPEAVGLFGEPEWYGKNTLYADIFYMKAYSLIIGIILARGLQNGGVRHNEDFNGKNGIFLVCDEINALQDNFLSVTAALSDMIPIQESKFENITNELLKAYKSSKDSDAKKGDIKAFDTVKDTFVHAFNARKFYALTYLGSLVDTQKSIEEISKLGFTDEEMNYSDIIVIGQDLENIPFTTTELKETITSARLAGRGSDVNNGLGKSEAANNLKGDRSIPLAHFAFRAADAFIGYNIKYQKYLAQGDPSSKANGKLDQFANNFCYLPSFSLNVMTNTSPLPTGTQLTKELANRSTSVYFKPYLILNDSDTNSEYVKQMYDRVTNAGISIEDLIKEYPNEAGDNLSRFVGFKDYLDLTGVKDLESRLKHGADIINNILQKYIKYTDDGSGRPLWLQYVTDLRVEWLLSAKDIIELCTGNEKVNTRDNKSSITYEYYRYIDFVKNHPELGIVDDCLSAYNNGETSNEFDSTYESDGRRDFTNEFGDMYYCQTCGHSDTSPISIPCPMCGGNPNENGGTWTCDNGHKVSINVDKCPQCGALRDISSDSDEEDIDDWDDTEETDNGVPESYDDESDDRFGGTDESSDDTEPEPIIFNTGEDEVIQKCKTCGYTNNAGVGNPCTHCGGDPNARGNTWICSNCHSRMSDRIKTCISCGMSIDNSMIPQPNTANEHQSQPSPFSHTEASTYNDTPENSYTEPYESDFVFKDDGRFHLFGDNAMMKQTSANLLSIIEEVVGNLSRVNNISIENGGHIIVNGIHINPSLTDEQIQQLPLDLRYKVSNGQWFELFHGKDLAKFKNLRQLIIADMSMADKVCLDTGKADVFKLRAWLESKTALNSLIVAGVEVREEEREYMADASRGSNFVNGVHGAFAGIKGIGGALLGACRNVRNSRIWNSGVGRFAKGVAAVGGIALALPLLTGIITGLGFVGTLNLAIACAGGAYNVVRHRKNKASGSSNTSGFGGSNTSGFGADGGSENSRRSSGRGSSGRNT